jgi:hypothetical protein
LAKFDELEIDIISISKFWRHPIMNHKQLVQQLNEMQSQMERYKAELANLRNQVSSYENVETPVPTSDTTSRRKLLKRLAIAGIGGIGAIGLAAATNPNYTVLAATASDNAVEAIGGKEGYGLQASGGLAPLRLVPAGDVVPVTVSNHEVGELYVDSGGSLFYCVTAGPNLPGAVGAASWRKIAGSASAGTLHYLPNPERYLSTGPYPTTFGYNTPFPAYVTRNLQITGHNGISNNSTLQIPNGAIGVTGTIFNLSGAGGTLTVWPKGAQQPTVATHYYAAGPSGSAFSSKLSTDGSISIQASVTCDITMDIVGYYL